MSSSSAWVQVPEAQYHGGNDKLKHALANIVAPVYLCAGLIANEHPSSATTNLLNQGVDRMRAQIDRYGALLRKTPLDLRPVLCSELARGRMDLSPTDGKKTLNLNLEATVTYVVDELLANNIAGLRLTFDHPLSRKDGRWAALIAKPGKTVLTAESLNCIGRPYASNELGLGLALVVAYAYKQAGKVYFNPSTSELAVLFPEP